MSQCCLMLSYGFKRWDFPAKKNVVFSNAMKQSKGNYSNHQLMCVLLCSTCIYRSRSGAKEAVVRTASGARELSGKV